MAAVTTVAVMHEVEPKQYMSARLSSSSSSRSRGRSPRSHLRQTESKTWRSVTTSEREWGKGSAWDKEGASGEKGLLHPFPNDNLFGIPEPPKVGDDGMYDGSISSLGNMSYDG